MVYTGHGDEVFLFPERAKLLTMKRYLCVTALVYLNIFRRFGSFRARLHLNIITFMPCVYHMVYTWHEGDDIEV